MKLDAVICFGIAGSCFGTAIFRLITGQQVELYAFVGVIAGEVAILCWRAKK